MSTAPSGSFLALSPDNKGETIAALATASGAAGIGVIRLSGPDAFLVAERTVRRPLASQLPRVLRRATVFVTLGGALIVYAVVSSPTGYRASDVPEVVLRVIAQLIR